MMDFLKYVPESMKGHIAGIFGGEYDVPAKLGPPKILDIGANIGAFTVWALNRWGGHIIAYEPNASNFEILRNNVAHLGERVELINSAVRRDISNNRLFDGKSNCGTCSFFQLGEQEETWTEVNIVKASDLPKGDILKIDTEGCELEILEELSALKRLTFKLILLEYHRRRDRKAIDDLLSDYTLWAISSTNPDRGVAKYVHNSGCIIF